MRHGRSLRDGCMGGDLEAERCYLASGEFSAMEASSTSKPLAHGVSRSRVNATDLDQLLD